MCDLWKNTLDAPTRSGDIPHQIRTALSELPSAKQVKLYNSGNFFDPRAVPPEDYPAIAQLVSGFERVILECHPSLIGESALRFRDMLNGRLEIAVGLETVDPVALAQLNKRLTVEQFWRAAERLAKNDIDLRVFILVRAPFQNEDEGLHWACRSLDVAMEAGARVAAVIPTRGGNGALDTLAEQGQFSPPSIRSLEAAHEYGLGLGKGIVYADLWDIERFCSCECSPKRTERMARMNRMQRVCESVYCDKCLQ